MCDRTRENVAGVTTSETSEPTSFSKQLPPTGCHCFSLVEPATNLFSLAKSWPRFPISIVLPYTVDATRAGSYGILKSRHFLGSAKSGSILLFPALTFFGGPSAVASLHVMFTGIVRTLNKPRSTTFILYILRRCRSTVVISWAGSVVYGCAVVLAPTNPNISAWCTRCCKLCGNIVLPSHGVVSCQLSTWRTTCGGGVLSAFAGNNCASFITGIGRPNTPAPPRSTTTPNKTLRERQSIGRTHSQPAQAWRHRYDTTAGGRYTYHITRNRPHVQLELIAGPYFSEGTRYVNNGLGNITTTHFRSRVTRRFLLSPLTGEISLENRPTGAIVVLRVTWRIPRRLRNTRYRSRAGRLYTYSISLLSDDS